MNPLQRLKQFKTPGAPTPKRPDTFVHKGVTYATPSPSTEQIPGFYVSSRGKAWAALSASLSP